MYSEGRETPAARRPGRLALVHFLVMLVTLAAILVACATTETNVTRTSSNDEPKPTASAVYKSKQTAKWSENNAYRN